MNNFTQRAITGLTFALIVTLAILFSAYSFLVVFLLINILGLIEFYNLVKNESCEPQIRTGVVVSVIFLLLFGYLLWEDKGLHYLLFTAPLISVFFISELYRNKKHPFQNIVFTLGGMMYLTFPIATLIYIALGWKSGLDEHYNSGVIMGSIFLIWASDTGAYMVGSKFGKHRLFERISPKKSWEGLAGGIMFSLLAAYLISLVFMELSFASWMILAIIVVITGTLGDLVESMLKRSLNVKDSGTFLPGHGGILDRFDGLFIAAPFILLYLLLS